MDPSFQSLLSRLDRLSDQFRDLREGMQKAIRIADEDPEMALTRARKVLEHVVREVYERRVGEPAGTRPLENLLQRLVKDGWLPTRLEAYANTVRMLGNVGAHRFGETVTTSDVYQSLTQLMPILEWYFEAERPRAQGPAAPPQTGSAAREPPRPAAPEGPVAIVPKGLRSFDGKDADFFLALLPGPRDRDGLPESVRFWKHAVEDRDEPAFTVGVIYGPSGCGKSSLVKAGLLPRLAGRVTPVYVEATAADTEARLLQGLRRRFPGAPADADLPGLLAALRRGAGLADGQKALLVVDQFEQWLHARRHEEDAELARALRQCDGERVQAVVLVRDDFWMALTRFLAGLNVELHQGRNAAAVDLFDAIHARAVLAAFGRAFGRLADEPTKEQAAFLDQAVAGLSQDGRVVCVRLALFAEMVKGRPWTPATLKAVGGTEGVGAAFLEETFGAANARNRRHQNAARSVLRALLPEQGTDIKGHMRSSEELLEASGYARRPADFEELVRVLDGEARLLTPTQPPESDAAAEPPSPPPGKYYQLTHDYLVPSLREWLTRKQRETMRGRAELRLAERAAAWDARPEARQLPAWWEWLHVRLFTRKRDWTPPQRKMMGKAARYHGLRAAGVALVLAATTWTGLAVWGQIAEQRHADRAADLVDQLGDSDIAQVPGVIETMAPYRRWADPKLREACAEAEGRGDARRRLRLSLGLLPTDGSQAEYLYGRLLDAESPEVGVIVRELAGRKDDLTDRLWSVAERPEKGREGRRLRAAAALARYDPDGPRWDAVARPVAEALVAVAPASLADWEEAFRPVRDRLQAPLAAVFRDRGDGRAVEKGLATNLLADYAADRPAVTADLLLDADEKQFPVLYREFQEQGARGLPLLLDEISAASPPDAGQEAMERRARRRANAAVVLLRMNRGESVWPLFRHGPDPRVRSYLIHRLRPLGLDAGTLLARLDEERDVSARQALLLSLGEYDDTGLPAEARRTALPRVQDLFQTDADAGLHASAEWLLRRWGEDEWLRRVHGEWAGDRAGREKRIDGIRESLRDGRDKAPRWYVNGQGQTMVAVPGPFDFEMGAPKSDAGVYEEVRHRMRIPRTYAVSAEAVTVEQFRRFAPKLELPEKYTRCPGLPVVGVSWYEAAAYCNWLTEQELPKEQWESQRCYLPNAQGKYADGMRLAPDYLRRGGYRLPTEAEMEAATRAGAETSRYYGDADELLPKYVWHLSNAHELTWPVGSLKPNDWGLFDALGNVYTWCDERHASGPERETDEEQADGLVVSDRDERTLRGGSFLIQASVARCSYRSWSAPTDSGNLVGLRPARTLCRETLPAR